MPPAVSLRAAVCLAGRFPVLAGVDLSIDPGTVTVVEGPNGAGKTSLLRLCAGTLQISSGRGWVLGHDLYKGQRDLRRRIGVLGHAASLYDDLTVVENIRFAVRASGADTSEIEPAIERVGLTGRLKKTTAGRLSAGQRRRVAMAVLIARRPELWLLDEPHAALDASARALLDELVAEAAHMGTTVLLVSHEPERARPLADRVITMVGGRVVAEDIETAPAESKIGDQSAGEPVGAAGASTASVSEVDTKAAGEAEASTEMPDPAGSVGDPPAAIIGRGDMNVA